MFKLGRVHFVEADTCLRGIKVTAGSQRHSGHLNALFCFCMNFFYASSPSTVFLFFYFTSMPFVTIAGAAEVVEQQAESCEVSQ